VDGLARRGQDCGYLRALPLLRLASMVTFLARLVAGYRGSWDQALDRRVGVAAVTDAIRGPIRALGRLKRPGRECLV
jgi:hypothetical protein